MIDKLNQSIKHALATFKKDPPMRGSEWANANFFLSKESSYNEERWTGFPPQNIIIDIICSDGVEQINIMKSARVGYTKILLIALGYFQVHKKRNQAIWLPTDSDSIDFVKTQVNTMIRDVPAVREAFKNSFEAARSLLQRSEVSHAICCLTVDDIHRYGLPLQNWAGVTVHADAVFSEAETALLGSVSDWLQAAGPTS